MNAYKADSEEVNAREIFWDIRDVLLSLKDQNPDHPEVRDLMILTYLLGEEFDLLEKPPGR